MGTMVKEKMDYISRDGLLTAAAGEPPIDGLPPARMLDIECAAVDATRGAAKKCFASNGLRNFDIGTPSRIVFGGDP